LTLLFGHLAKAARQRRQRGAVQCIADEQHIARIAPVGQQSLDDDAVGDLTQQLQPDPVGNLQRGVRVHGFGFVVHAVSTGAARGTIPFYGDNCTLSLDEFTCPV